MAEADKEIDYMSEDFISQCVGNNDVRPGLIYSHASKRKAELEKKKRELDSKRAKFRPIKEVQKERLEEGLTTALSSSNKGFSMLQKMGYKPGTSLGKEGQGRSEPVPVEVKADRGGLGWKEMITEHRKRRQMIKQRQKDKKVEIMDPEKFRARMRNQRQERFINQDLMKSQRTCYEMDSKDGHTEPVETWFWPYNVFGNEGEEEEEEYEEEEEEVEFEPDQQLNILTSYLRSTYNYCIWCGTVFDDENDLKQNCPGPTRADHDDD